MAPSDNSQFEPPPPSEPASNNPGTFLTSSIEPTGVAPPARPAPAENPVWNGWDVLLIALLTFFVMVFLQLAVAVAARMLWYPHDTLLDAAQKALQNPTVVIVSQFLFYLPVALLMIALVEGKYRVPFWRGIGWNWPRSGFKFLALGAVALMLLTILESLLPKPSDTPFDRLFDRPFDAYLIAFIAVSIAPLMEELFFRGFLYPVIARRTGVVWGIFLSALPFGLLHLPQYGWAWSAALIILIVGIVCGIVRALTRSVAASFLVHVGYNGAQMLIAVLATRGFTHMPKSFVNFGVH